jgi:hypothetical protein
MKQNGRTLKQRLFGIRYLPDRLARVRHFRGHGVHSPYIYAIVRQVFMVKDLKEGDRTLYEDLLALGAPKRRAVQLQNLKIHCGYRHHAVNRIEEKSELVILTSDLGEAESRALFREAAVRRVTLVISRPYACRERIQFCDSLIEEHPCTSVDNRGYLLIFNNHLPKQHFRL